MKLCWHASVDESPGILHVLLKKQIECAHRDEAGW
jgi:hypothetical protein